MGVHGSCVVNPVTDGDTEMPWLPVHAGAAGSCDHPCMREPWHPRGHPYVRGRGVRGYPYAGCRGFSGIHIIPSTTLCREVWGYWATGIWVHRDI